MNHKIKWVPIATSMLLAFSVGCSSEDGDDAPSSWVSSSSSEWSTSSSNTSTSTTTSSSSTTFSSDNVQQKILRHAGYSVADIEGYRFNTVLNNGFQQYEAIFYVRSDGKTEEHTYYLSTTDATILSNTVTFLPPDYTIEEEEDIVTDDTGITFESIAGQLTESQAKAIVTQDAGVSEFSISGFTINERTSGTIQEYEITFGTNTADYYYTIMAASGIITFSRMTPLQTTIQPEVTVPDTGTTTTPSTGTTTTPSTGTTTTPSTGTTTTPSTGTTTTPSTDTTTTPNTNTTTPEVPDVVVPDVVLPEVTVPEVSTPVAPSLSNLDAKNAALRFAGVSESEIDRLAITELTDSTGSVYEYQVDFFHQVNFHTYRVSASTGAVRIS